MTTTTATLADELAAAELAAAGPRRQAADLQGELTAAIGAARFDEAHRLQAEMATAQEARALADARVAALRGGAARLGSERDAQARAISEAEQRDQAARDQAAAREDEAAAIDQMNGAIGQVRELLGAARHQLRVAESFQEQATAARGRELNARYRLNPLPPGHPGPPVARVNAIDVLIGTDSLIRELARGTR